MNAGPYDAHPPQHPQQGQPQYPQQQGPGQQPRSPGGQDPFTRVPAPRPRTAPLVNPEDARATLEARKELGPEMDQALVDSFVARVEQALVAQGGYREAERQRQAEVAKADSRNQMVLGIVSLGVAIPLTAIFAGISGLAGGLIVWIGIVLVNMAYAMRKGRREER